MFRKSINLIIIIAFVCTLIPPLPKAQAQTLLGLPEPGTMVSLSPAYHPAIIKGLTVHKDNPFLFDFIVDVGQDHLQGQALKKEGEKLIKYFLASLAIPEKDLWVNLSPYEKDRIIPHALGQTEMGRDLLAEDYMLKQITASLIYPEKNLGRTFWDKVYAIAQAKYGTTQIPVNTFNKVWIMADKAEVFEHNQTVFVVNCHLKVMLEEDYLALQKHSNNAVIPEKAAAYSGAPPKAVVGIHDISSQIIREIILPQLEQEVNTGKNFANLRQICNSLILASWYKKNLKEALLNQVYADKEKVKGIDLQDKTIKEQIYQRYLQAYKKGVFNYIKEDFTDPLIEKEEIFPRKYFSGGFLDSAQMANPTTIVDPWVLDSTIRVGQLESFHIGIEANGEAKIDTAMIGLPIALTGATGFLGSALSRTLEKARARPRALVWNGDEAQKLRQMVPNFDHVVGALVDVDQIKALVRGKNAFINLAADTRTVIKMNQTKEASEILTSNVLGAAVALLAAKDENNDGMRKIFISSFDYTKVRGEAEEWADRKAESISQYAVDYYSGRASKTPQAYFEEMAQDAQAFNVAPYPLSKYLMDKVLENLAERFKVQNVLVLRIMGPIGVEMAKSQAFGVLIKLVNAILTKQELPEAQKATPYKGVSASLISVDDIVQVLIELSQVKLTAEQAEKPLFLELGGPYMHWTSFTDQNGTFHKGVVTIIAEEAHGLGVSLEGIYKNIKIVDPGPGFVNVEAKVDLEPLQMVLGHPVHITSIEEVIRGITRAVYEAKVNALVDEISEKFEHNIKPKEYMRFQYLLRWFLKGDIFWEDFKLKITDIFNLPLAIKEEQAQTYKNNLADAVIKMAMEKSRELPTFKQDEEMVGDHISGDNRIFSDNKKYQAYIFSQPAGKTPVTDLKRMDVGVYTTGIPSVVLKINLGETPKAIEFSSDSKYLIVHMNDGRTIEYHVPDEAMNAVDKVQVSIAGDKGGAGYNLSDVMRVVDILRDFLEKGSLTPEQQSLVAVEGGQKANFNLRFKKAHHAPVIYTKIKNQIGALNRIYVNADGINGRHGQQILAVLEDVDKYLNLKSVPTSISIGESSHQVETVSEALGLRKKVLLHEAAIVPAVKFVSPPLLTWIRWRHQNSIAHDDSRSGVLAHSGIKQGDQLSVLFKDPIRKTVIDRVKEISPEGIVTFDNGGIAFKDVARITVLNRVWEWNTDDLIRRIQEHFDERRIFNIAGKVLELYSFSTLGIPIDDRYGTNHEFKMSGENVYLGFFGNYLTMFKMDAAGDPVKDKDGRQITGTEIGNKEITEEAVSIFKQIKALETKRQSVLPQTLPEVISRSTWQGWALLPMASVLQYVSRWKFDYGRYLKPRDEVRAIDDQIAVLRKQLPAVTINAAHDRKPQMTFYDLQGLKSLRDLMKAANVRGLYFDRLISDGQSDKGRTNIGLDDQLPLGVEIRVISSVPENVDRFMTYLVQRINVDRAMTGDQALQFLIDNYDIIKNIHRLGFIGLAQGLIVGKFLQELAQRTSNLALKEKYYWWRSKLVHWGAPVATAIIIPSGLALSYVTGYSIDSGWFLALIGLTAFESPEGIIHYLPDAKFRAKAAKESLLKGEMTQELYDLENDSWSNFLLWLDVVSMGTLLSLGKFKPDLPGIMVNQLSDATNFKRLIVNIVAVAVIGATTMITVRAVDKIHERKRKNHTVKNKVIVPNDAAMQAIDLANAWKGQNIGIQIAALRAIQHATRMESTMGHPIIHINIPFLLKSGFIGSIRDDNIEVSDSPNGGVDIGFRKFKADDQYESGYLSAVVSQLNETVMAMFGILREEAIDNFINGLKRSYQHRAVISREWVRDSISFKEDRIELRRLDFSDLFIKFVHMLLVLDYPENPYGLIKTKFLSDTKNSLFSTHSFGDFLAWLRGYMPRILDAVEDPAMSTGPGGIDLNTSKTAWKDRKEGPGVEMKVDPAMVERVRREGIDSLDLEIYSITPVTSIWPLIGLEQPKRLNEYWAGV